MSTPLFSRYLWIVDTLRRYGRMKRSELSDRWERASVSDGRPMPRRTFYNYRNAIAELFGIQIECDPATFEYFIASTDSHTSAVTDWMLNQVATGQVVGDAAEVSSRIFVEDVPSARQHLSTVISALKECRQLHFDYHPYTRVNPQRDIVVEPYFLKIFRQRWYVTGRNAADNLIKTYALDRMTDVTVGQETFTIPADFDAEAYCGDSFGIVFTQGEVKDISIKADTRTAKYLRTLPLHPSQQETIHDSYSIFHYRMRLTGDLVEELLSYGPRITVLAPAELRAMVMTELRNALANY